MSSRPRHWHQHHWRPDQAWTLADAIGFLLDDLEALYEPGDELPVDPLPLSTGVDAVDRVCGGGLHLGELTVVEADLCAQARALVCTVARRIEHPVLLDAGPVVDTAAWLVAGASGVPHVLVRTGRLEDSDWNAIVAAVRALAEREVWVSESDTLPELAGQVAGRGAEVVLVHELERFGPPIKVVPALAELAATAGVAVLATATAMGELPEWSTQRTRRVAMLPHGLAGRAALVRPDAWDVLSVAQVDVDGLVAALR
jgi:hypothetical protein